MEICKLENVSKTYMMGEKVCPLQDVSLVVNSGDFISIEGPSGIGKSTLLYVMGSLLKLDEGKLYLDNQDINLLTDQQLTTLRAEKIGFVFQKTNLIEALTLQENLEFAQSLGKKSKTDSQEIVTLLGRLVISFSSINIVLCIFLLAVINILFAEKFLKSKKKDLNF